MTASSSKNTRMMTLLAILAFLLLVSQPLRLTPEQRNHYTRKDHKGVYHYHAPGRSQPVMKTIQQKHQQNQQQQQQNHHEVAVQKTWQVTDSDQQEEWEQGYNETGGEDDERNNHAQTQSAQSKPAPPQAGGASFAYQRPDEETNGQHHHFGDNQKKNGDFLESQSAIQPNDDDDDEPSDNTQSADSDNTDDDDDNIERRPFVCNPTFPSRAKRRTPIVLFSGASSSLNDDDASVNDDGVNLLFYLIRQLLVSPPSTSEHRDPNTRVKRTEQLEAHYLDLHNLFVTNTKDTDAIARNSDNATIPNIPQPLHHHSVAESIVTPEQAGYAWDMALAMAQNCRDTDLAPDLHPLMDQNYNALRLFAKNNPQLTIQFLQDQADHGKGNSQQPRPHLQTLLQVLEDRHGNVASAMSFISEIPLCPAENAQQQSFWGVHFSEPLLRHLELSPQELVPSLMEEMASNKKKNTKDDHGLDVGTATSQHSAPMHVIVIWRRNMLQSFVQQEAFVSQQKHQSIDIPTRTSGSHAYHKPSMMEKQQSNSLLSSFNLWEKDGHRRRTLRGGTDENIRREDGRDGQAVMVDVDRLKSFVDQHTRYYTELRDALTQSKIPFTVFEYEHDLSTKTDNANLLTSVQRLQKLLGLTHSDIRHARQIVAALTHKQHDSFASYHHTMIANADQVRDAGWDPYTSSNWPDIFEKGKGS